MAKGTFHIGHAGGHHTVVAAQFAKTAAKRAASSDCASGGFYKAPAQGAKVSANEPFTISWDPTCLNSTAVDIYLYAPGATAVQPGGWSSIPISKGSLTTTLEPRWWNDTASAQLQLRIVEAGALPFMATLPAGPVFTATYDASNKTLPSSATDTSRPLGAVAGETSKHGISKGATAAAVLLPLLAILGLCAYAYVRIKRARGKDKRREFAEGVDKRMSTISNDWRAITPAGAQAAVRHSMAQHRASTFSFSAPVSQGGVLGGLGVVPDAGHPEMAQLRTQVRSVYGAGAERVSRVSFAEPQARTSRISFAEGTRFSRASMALDPAARASVARSRFFDADQVPVPPLPVARGVDSSDSSTGRLSPTQAEGPYALTTDDVVPALTLMRAGALDVDPRHSAYVVGDEPVDDDDYILPAAAPNGGLVNMPAPPMPAHPAQQPMSSTMGFMPMAPVTASPDELLRNYARQGSAAPRDVNGMRVLYPQPQ